jgi:hypothetical protein
MNTLESDSKEFFNSNLFQNKLKKSLVNQLDILPETTMLIINEPENYFKLMPDFPLETQLVLDKNSTNLDLIHYFEIDFNKLSQNLTGLKDQIYKNGSIWVSFPVVSIDDFSDEKIDKLAKKNDMIVVKKIEFDFEFLAYKFCFKVKESKFKDLLNMI